MPCSGVLSCIIVLGRLKDGGTYHKLEKLHLTVSNREIETCVSGCVVIPKNIAHEYRGGVELSTLV